MCNDEIRVKNPTTNYKPGISKVYLNAPCGKCPSCIQQNQNDWFLRMYAEFLRNKRQLGISLFVTLTYKDSHLPRFSDLGLPSSQSCFSKQDIDTFIKNLHRYFGETFGSSEGLRYFIASEYGSKTKRPHYHGQIYFPFRPFMSVRVLKALVSKAWSHGWVLWSKEEKGGAEIKNEVSILYCSKYVAKDLSFYGLDEVVRVDDLMRSYKNAPVGSDKRAYYNKYRQCLPRHYQSKLFGYDVLKELFVDKYDENTGEYTYNEHLDYHLEHGYRIPMTSKVYRIPRYVLNRLCYDTDNKGHRYVNEIGKDLLTYMLRKRLDKFAVELNRDLTSLGITALCAPRYLRTCFTREDGYAKFAPSSEHLENAYKLSLYVKELMRGRSFQDLAIYAVLLKDRNARPFLDDIQYFNISNYQELADRIIFETYHNPNDWRYPDGTPSHLHRPRKFQEETALMFNDLPEFELFDAVLAIHTQLKHWASSLRSKAKAKKEEETRNIRDLFNSYNLYTYVS